MSIYTEQIATEFNFPNIIVYKKYQDDIHCGYRISPAEGYVMYDPSANNTESCIDEETGLLIIDEETGFPVEIPATYYHTVLHCPLSYSFDNFIWIAALEADLDNPKII